MLVTAFIQLVPDIGVTSSLVIPLAWPHISLRCIIFQVPSQISPYLMAIEGGFLMVKRTAVLIIFIASSSMVVAPGKQDLWVKGLKEGISY